MAAGIHAAARAVSGGPVYVSDCPGSHSFEVLRQLVLPDGSVLRASLPGRPTRDTLLRSASAGADHTALRCCCQPACPGWPCLWPTPPGVWPTPCSPCCRDVLRDGATLLKVGGGRGLGG